MRNMLPNYEGPVVEGDETVLAETFDDVTLRTKWARSGFTRVQLPGGPRTHSEVCRRVDDYLRRRARAAGLDFARGMPLGAYHRIPGLNDELHLRVAAWGVPFEMFGLDGPEILDFISAKVGKRMRFFFLNDDPAVRNMCGLRVIRPRLQDHNPFHRDGWFDTLRHAVTLWVPLLNCTAGSSLRLFRGSHLWPESRVQRTPEGARLGAKKYKVPALVALSGRSEPEEPLVSPGRGLLFSSFLIHGGGRNLHEDATRISFELRFIKENLQ